MPDSIFDDNRLNELGAQKAQCLRQRSRERQGIIQEVGAVCRGTHSAATAPGTTTTRGRDEARTHHLSPRASTSFSPKRSDAGNFFFRSESQQVRQKQGAGGVSPEHPRQDIPLASPPDEGQNSNGACAGAAAGVVDSSILPGLPSSPPSRTGAAADVGRGGGEMNSPQTVQSGGWGGGIREPGSDDEVLEYFLARHAKEPPPPPGEGTGRQSPRRGAAAEDRGVDNGAAESERDTKVLW